MNEIEKYEFDRLGYLVIKEMLTPDQVAVLRATIDELEEHALARIEALPRKKAAWGHEYHADDERHYHAGERAESKTLMIEDFWNASPVFDLPPIMRARWLYPRDHWLLHDQQFGDSHPLSQ